MTNPLRRTDSSTDLSSREEVQSLADRILERVDAAERAAREAQQIAEARNAEAFPEPPKKSALQRFGGFLLLWSLMALAASVGILAWETVGPGGAVRASATERPPLEFGQLSTRHVQSAEGAALEITGILKNVGSERADPAVTLQLAGNRVAIEEPLRLGQAPLPPGAERPFAVRILLPEDVQSVSLLPLTQDPSSEPHMVLISPGWTAEKPGL